MRLLALIGFACLASATLARAEEPDYRAKTEALLRNGVGEFACFPLAAGPSKVFVLHTYYGGNYNKTKLAPAPGQAPIGVVDVAVDYSYSPVMVIAVAYEPQIWRFTLSPGVRLAGVQLFGYHEQYVDGVPDGTPLGRMYQDGSSGEDAIECGNPQRAALRAQTGEVILQSGATIENLESAVEAARVRAFNYDKFVEQFATRLDRAAPPQVPEDASAEAGEQILAAYSSAIEQARAAAQSVAEDAAGRFERATEELAQTRNRESQALASVARLDEDGRMPPPFDGWFTIDYKQDLNALAAAIHMFGHYRYMGYRDLENTMEGSFVIRADGSIGPDAALREVLPDRPVKY